MKRKVYKMKKILSIALLILTAFGLFSCGDDDGIPEGMKLGCDPNATGYYFYIPDSWTESSFGEISAAHVSSLDNSSVSVAKMDREKIGADITGEWDIAKEFIAAYAQEDIASIPADSDIEFVRSGEKNYDDALLGDRPAVRFVYTFSINDAKTGKAVKFKTLQLLTRHNSEVYILTFQSRDEIMREQTTYYDYYYTMVAKVIENFRFTEGQGAATENPADTDSDGYYLASDPSLSGFELYLPNGYDLEYSSGLVSAKISDGAHITMTQATSTGVSIVDYATTRRKELSAIFDDFTDLSVSVKSANAEALKLLKDTFDELSEENIKVDSALKLGNSDSNMFAYEYTFKNGDTVYRVYQIYGISGRAGYAFTYTARSEVYEAHVDEISDILERIVFK